MTAPSAPTLPTGPAEHVALDHAALLAEGVRRVARLAGDQWTDFNLHDPGLTILEQLCHAITDLAYRIDHPMPDLLAGSDPAAMPGPVAVLTGDPVTADDLRRLVLDTDGVGNAWVEPPPASEPGVYYHRGRGELRLQIDPGEPDVRPVEIVGLQRVWLQPAGGRPADAVVRDVAARLHARRGLGSDVEVAALGVLTVGLRAQVEIAAVDDPVDVLADILERIDAYLAPAPRFTALADAVADGRRVDELCDGPALAHGVLVGPLPDVRRTVRASDLLHVITDVPAVRAIRSLVLPGRGSTLAVPPGTVPALAPDADITLLRAGIRVPVAPAAARARLEARRTADARTADPGHLAAPAGRDRRLAAYRSIQHQLPAAYGVGPLGLPASASPVRRAQADQLAAYLLLFDQLLADAFAQLAHAHALLAPDAGRRTYFSQPIADPALGLDRLLRQDDTPHLDWLAGAHEDPDGEAALARRRRFLTHLLARYAEQLGDHAQIDGAGESGGWNLAEDKAAFLRDYPRLGGARGSGHDVLDPTAPGGLAERLRHKLGRRGCPPFHVVERVLLRPLPEDLRQLGDDTIPQVPLLADVDDADPWSLQVDYVFAGEPASEAFERLVVETLLAETPAHLRPRLLWLADDGDGADWTDFTAAWSAFQAAHRAYREAALSGAPLPDAVHLRARDARDRVIDLLGFARTYPLRDLPVGDDIVVSPGEPATITIGLSQRGVVYALRDRRTGAPILRDGKPFEVVGTGDAVALETPPILVDTSYRILAVKPASPAAPEPREAWLHTVVRVEVGVDPKIAARFVGLDLLDPTIDAPKPTDARLTDHRAKVEVELLAPQEGVRYVLVDAANPDTIVSEGPVEGAGDRVVLRTRAVLEDFDVRVRGTRTVGDPQHPEVRSALLDVVLPLRVRADRSLAYTLETALLDPGAPAVARLPASQRSARYRVAVRPIRDREFVFVDPPPDGTLTSTESPIRVRPEGPLDRAALTPAGPALPGTGAAPLDLAFSLTRDAFVHVVATKEHRRTATSDERLASEVVLAARRAAFVHPDPQAPVVVEATLPGNAKPAALALRDGQPGTLYELSADDVPLGAPAYFHQRDDRDARVNKGIDQLTIGVDFVVARDVLPAATPAEAAAAPPIVDITPLAPGAPLKIVARRAMNRLAVALGTYRVDVVPAIVAEPATVPSGGAATLVIDGTHADDRYTLLRDDQPVASARGGAQVRLATGPLTPTTALVVLVERPTGRAPRVLRRVVVVVPVTPA